MEASILLVSKNRKEALQLTLDILKPNLDLSRHEVLVFLDGCTDSSADLIDLYPWVDWYGAENSVGASRARNKLYKNAKGAYFIGFDDDSHPLNSDFIEQLKRIFKKYPNVGILSFEEIKGIYRSDDEAIKNGTNIFEEYLTNEFIGCGFAIRKNVYQETSGFPVWMEIYGEESCLSIEVLSKGYDILFTNSIKVNHRVDKKSRKIEGQNYYRFEQQLKNVTGFYLIYHKRPFIKIIKLYSHNFKKYALKDAHYFYLYMKVFFSVLFNISTFLSYRKPVENSIIKLQATLKPLKY